MSGRVLRRRRRGIQRSGARGNRFRESWCEAAAVVVVVVVTVVVAALPEAEEILLFADSPAATAADSAAESN